MSEIEFTDAQPEQVDELPAELPVLPLKETDVFAAAFGSNGRVHSNGRVRPASSRR